MHYVILTIVLLTIIFLPNIWVNHVLRKYSEQRPDFPGTGGELAEHLIERFDLTGVDVIISQSHVDFYDPIEKNIFLSPDHYNSKSISAVSIAANEVGHAIQHYEDYLPFTKKLKRIRWANKIERISTSLLMASPFVFFLTHTPHGFLFMIIAGAMGLIATLVVHLINLPVEYDASMNRALPMLSEGYLLPSDIPAAQRVLKAATFSYVASALSYFLNIGRWFLIFRR